MADTIIRATAAGAQIRAFVADTKETVMTAYEKHHTYPVMTAALGRLLTAGALMGAMLKNEGDRLTLKIDGDGPGSGLVVAADYLSRVKGYAINPHVDIPLKPNGKLDVSGAIGNGTLTVIKDMGLKEPYVGTTNLVTGEIAEDITYYFSLSEQIPSSVGLGVLVDTDCSVKCAGGFILQLMPFASDETIDRLEANLKNISSVTSMYDSGMTAKDILYKLLDGFDVEINDENIHAAHLLMDKLNSTLKYVKANKLGDSMWLFYERELYGGEDFEKLLSRMILHLEAARTSTAMLWRISRRNLTARMMTSPLVTMRKQRKQQ